MRFLLAIMAVGGRVISDFEFRCWAARPSQSDTRLPLNSIDSNSTHPHPPSSFTNSQTRVGQWQAYYEDMGFFTSRKTDDAASTTATTTIPVSHSAAGDRSMVQVIRTRFVRPVCGLHHRSPLTCRSFPISVVCHAGTKLSRNSCFMNVGHD